MQLIYVPARDQYTCYAGTDPDLPHEQRIEHAKEMEQALVGWAKEHGIDLTPHSKPLPKYDCEPLYHTTMRDALEFMQVGLWEDLELTAKSCPRAVTTANPKAWAGGIISWRAIRQCWMALLMIFAISTSRRR